MAIKTPAEYKNMEFVGLLQELSKLYKPKRYVEIGVKGFYTFHKMCYPWIEERVAVDIDEKVMGMKYGEVKERDGVTKYCMSSSDFAKAWEKRKGDWIDFLFIDGDHSMKAVIDDFDNLVRFVLPLTGLIFLHDTYPIKRSLAVDGYCSTAWKAAQFIREERNDICEIVTLPGPWAGLSIIRRVNHGDHLHWAAAPSEETKLDFLNKE